MIRGHNAGRLTRNVARTTARSIVLLVLAFAPLACLRFCQLGHMVAAHEHGTAALVSAAHCAPETGPGAMPGNSGERPSEGNLMHEIQRMLAGLTEFMPAVISVTLLLIAHRRACLQQPARLLQVRDIPTPPPRWRLMAA